MAVADDIAVAREAAQVLQRAADRLAQHYGDSVDARRLRLDATRLRDDLDLLCGLPTTAARGEVQPIDDVPYSSDLWADAEDEGVGPSRH